MTPGAWPGQRTGPTTEALLATAAPAATLAAARPPAHGAAGAATDAGDLMVYFA